MIFVPTADFDLAFHKNNPYFPLFKETLREKNILIRICGMYRDRKLDEPCSICRCSLQLSIYFDIS